MAARPTIPGMQRLARTATQLARWLTPLAIALSAACQTPCDELADRLCLLAPDDAEQCVKWQERSKRVPTKTCEAGLRQLDRDRVR